MKIKAVIFDFDGVLSQTECYKMTRVLEAMGRFGIRMEKSALWRLTGLNRVFLSQRLDEQLGDQEAFRLHREDLREIYCAELPYLALRTPGAVELLRTLKERGITVAVASNSFTERLVQVLDACELTEYVDLQAPAAGLGPHKPDPFIYLWTMEKLGLGPEECVVVEDSPLGIQSARAAGLRVLALRDPERLLDQSGADLVMDSLGEVLDYLDRRATESAAPIP